VSSMKHRKDREAAEVARVERLLTAAAVDQEFLSEPPHDLVARALRRATPAIRPKAAVARWGFGAFGSAVAACAGIAFGAIQFTQHLAARPRPLPTPVIVGTKPTPPIAPTPATDAADAQTAPIITPPRALLAQSEPRRRRRWHTVRRAASPVEVAINTHPSPGTESVAPPHPRPYWRDEEVERDDYVGYAPAVVAEGTGDDVASVTPALVQVSFSTTHPIAQTASPGYDTEH